MITCIYLFGVLITFFLLLLKISANNMWSDYSDNSGKLSILFMSLFSWLAVLWLFFIDEYEL
jgi:hypothetical protein